MPWTPNALEYITEALDRVGKEKEGMSADDWRSCIRSFNLLQNEYVNQKAYLPTVFEQEIKVEAGIRDYELPAGTVEIISLAIQQSTEPYYTVMGRMTYEEWNSIPFRDEENRPYRYFFDRRAETETQGPRIRLYYLPIEDSVILAQLQMRATDIEELDDDVQTASRWYECICADLACRFALKWAPERLEYCSGMAKMKKDEAWEADTMRTSVMVSPKPLWG